MAASSSDSASAPVFAVRSRTVVVAGAALLTAVSLWRFGLSGEGVVASAFCSVLVVLSAIDLERRVIPNRIVLPAGVLVLLANVAVAPDRALEWTLAAFGAALLFLVLALVYPGGLGMGDVKLAFLLGAGLGQAVAGALVIGTLVAAAAGVAIVVRRGLSARKETIAFGPCLALGAVLALFLS